MAILLLLLTLFVVALILQFYGSYNYYKYLIFIFFLVQRIWKLKFLPELNSTVLLGIVIGGIIRLVGSFTSAPSAGHSLYFIEFHSSIFFNGFLPPIIFNSGYQLNRRLFFDNMGAILALAILGTTFSTLLTGFCLWAVGNAGLSTPLTLMYVAYA